MALPTQQAPDVETCVPTLSQEAYAPGTGGVRDGELLELSRDAVYDNMPFDRNAAAAETWGEVVLDLPATS